MTEAKDLIAQRETLYGPSWSAHGEVLQPLAVMLADFHVKYPRLFFAWNLIFNKLLRALTSPMKRDHWLDIQGYAQLVIDDLDRIAEEQAVEKEEDD